MKWTHAAKQSQGTVLLRPTEGVKPFPSRVSDEGFTSKCIKLTRLNGKNTKHPNCKMRKGPEETFSQRYASGHQIHRDGLSTADHQGDANGTTMRRHPTPVRMSHQKNGKQVSARPRTLQSQEDRERLRPGCRARPVVSSGVTKGFRSASPMTMLLPGECVVLVCM